MMTTEPRVYDKHEHKPHTCPRCTGYQGEVATYTGVCFTCISRRWEEAHGAGYKGPYLMVVNHNPAQGSTQDNPAPLPRQG